MVAKKDQLLHWEDSFNYCVTKDDLLAKVVAEPSPVFVLVSAPNRELAKLLATGLTSVPVVVTFTNGSGVAEALLDGTTIVVIVVSPLRSVAVVVVATSPEPVVVADV